MDPQQPGQNLPAPFTPNQQPSPQTQFGGLKQVAPNVYFTDFNDPSVTKWDFKLYKGRNGVTDRVHLLLPTPQALARARVHYMDRGATRISAQCLSVYVVSSDGKRELLQEERQCCKLMGTPQLRFAVLMVHYGTDPRGNFVKPFTFETKLWRFGSDKYETLRQLNQDFGLANIDLGITCTEENWQRMTIANKPDCWFTHPNFPQKEKKETELWANASVPQLPRQVGGTQYQNEAALLKALQEGGFLTQAGPTPGMVAADQPVANFEDLIGQATVQQGPATPLK